ncbi:glycoside hydrolase family 13 protein [Arthrobacter dokdonensis]|uniref:glycoside hydrolase family 13 protein n=1 Tax=Arthrobacter dokdonellae TaxID=2211210 RepID=UPI001D131BD5|nr:alpha-glucosidase [Arthrobacter dokdonellae]
MTSPGQAMTEWWRNAVVYQVYPRSFADSNGDGIGDLPGVIAKLDYLKSLGVDVLWLSPFYPSPQVDNGYDISDYRGVDPMFGTLDDLDALIAGLHSRGMKFMTDIVINHTSDQHPWFTESRKNRTNAKRDWYIWRSARAGHTPGAPGAEPTNWVGFFGEKAWTLDEESGEYYMHLFCKEQPDLNWENADVRQELYAMMRWWLARGVDGFRMDVINLISKTYPLADSTTKTSATHFEAGALFAGGPRLGEFLAEMRREVNGSTDKVLLTVGEMPGTVASDAAGYTNPDNSQIDMIFQFEHMDIDRGTGRYDPIPWRLTDLKRTLGRWQDALAGTGWNSLYWGNHDQSRPVSRFGSARLELREHSAKMLATVLHLHRGTPYIYQGEELGMANYPFETLEDFDDVDAYNSYRIAQTDTGDTEAILAGLRHLGRDNSRTPMQWDATTNAGFTTGTPWLPVNPNHVDVNAAVQINDAGSVFHHYRRLIGLRHALDTVSLGSFEMLLPEDETIYAFTRTHGSEQLLVVANFSDNEPEVPLDAADWNQLVMTTYPDGLGPGGPTRLRPREARIYRRRTTTH